MYKLPKPYLLYLSNSESVSETKVANAVLDWERDSAAAFFALPDCKVKLNLPFITPEDAKSQGINALVIAFANLGGFLTDEDVKVVVRALQSGLDVILGMHVYLDKVPEVVAACEKYGTKVYNVRHYHGKINADSGEKRTGKRILTVGTDCSVGKMYATIAINNELQKRNVKSKFAATGQTGIILSGEGIAVDAVISDFIASAAAMLSPNAADDFYYVVEGQASLHHPSYSGVTLGLLHGSQPDYIVICHDPVRKNMRHTNYSIPSIEETIEFNLMHAKRTNPNAQIKGIVLNLSRVSDTKEKLSIIAEYEKRYKLPVADIFNVPVANIVDNILS